jgi:hypothetical protein
MLSPLPQRKSFKAIKPEGQVHGKLMARRPDMSRECFGFLMRPRQCHEQGMARKA